MRIVISTFKDSEWGLIEAVIVLTALIIPLTFQLVNFLIERILDERLDQKSDILREVFFIDSFNGFSDYVVAEVVFNSLFFLLAYTLNWFNNIKCYLSVLYALKMSIYYGPVLYFFPRHRGRNRQTRLDWLRIMHARPHWIWSVVIVAVLFFSPMLLWILPGASTSKVGIVSILLSGEIFSWYLLTVIWHPISMLRQIPPRGNQHRRNSSSI